MVTNQKNQKTEEEEARLAPSKMAKFASEINSFAKLINPSNSKTQFSLLFKTLYGDSTYLQVQLQKRLLCLKLIDYISNLAIDIKNTDLGCLLSNFYDVNTDSKKGDLIGKIDITLHDDETLRSCNDAPIDDDEKHYVETVKNFINRRDLKLKLKDFEDKNILSNCWLTHINEATTLNQLILNLVGIANDLCCEACYKLDYFSDEDATCCYHYWEERCLDISFDVANELEVWQNSIFKKNRIKELNAKKREYIGKVYEAGFLDHLIEQLEVYESEDKKEFFINGNAYELRGGCYYPVSTTESNPPKGTREQLLAQYAIHELLEADEKPNPDSIGRYLLSHRRTISYKKIEAFFKFVITSEWIDMKISEESLGESGTSHASPALPSTSKPSPVSTWHPSDALQQEICRRLTANGYCHVENDHYRWDATLEEFGYLILYATRRCKNGTHPSNGRILWDMFCPYFCIDKKGKKQAQNAVSKLTNKQLRKESASYKKAEKIRILVK